jgi:alkylation response protein AidB-like acyl-CoA dehydrogenase
MRFALSDEQRLLQEMANDLSKRALGRIDEPEGWQRSWSDLTETGLAGILVAGADGGAKGSLTDACVVAEVLGRHCISLPFVATSIAAVSLLKSAGEASALSRIAGGETIAVLLDGALGWPEDQAEVAFGWYPGSRGVQIEADGQARLVDLGNPRAVDKTDQLYPVHAIDPVTANRGSLTEATRRAHAFALTGAAAMLSGLAAGAQAQATAYAKQRVQYGHPIGSYQAIQHLCADLLYLAETAHSVALGASWVVEHAELAEAERTALAAKAYTSRAAIKASEGAIQVLGGIGVTKEHDAHLRLRVAHTFAALFGGLSGPTELLAAAAYSRS